MDHLLLYLRAFVIGPYLKGKEEIPDDDGEEPEEVRDRNDKSNT